MATNNTTLQALQAQLPALQKKYQDAVTAFTTAQNDVNNWRQKAQDCQAARDQYSVSWKKNQACDINLLGQYNQKWGDAEKALTTATTNVTAAKSALDNLNAQIDALNKQNQDALMSDPNFALQAAQITSQQQQQQQQTTEAEKTKRTLWIVGIVTGGIAVISGVIALIVHFKHKSA